ncbi:MAG: Macrolide export ATP-binding/permease protein MacB [Alphaproteobacteria bacterium MarineAlpha11_Bin1]|nr:MAG: Macrolide export ATP-binding/permease protein MacB [Alphaproteobacteria bacterium MarineAlpha11_Bin1]|tara:strand:+ start:183 stop:857 length:675 start_codon:yes stop_codon:yes gene_type:complete
MALLKLRDESAGYDGKSIIRNVSLAIEPGERIALVGESGAGKSTLLRLIYGRLGNAAALMPQDPSLVQALTVFHNVYMGRLHQFSVWRNLRNLLVPVAEDVEEVRKVLAPLRLEEKIFSNVSQLSGGQYQRTALARALFHPGRVIVADEPVSSVDEHQAREILAKMNGEKQTVLLAMHDRALALEFADRIVGIRDGYIAMDTPSAGMTPKDLDELYLSESAVAA